jgi:hypothetical protein
MNRPMEATEAVPVGLLSPPDPMDLTKLPRGSWQPDLTQEVLCAVRRWNGPVTRLTCQLDLLSIFALKAVIMIYS